MSKNDVLQDILSFNSFLQQICYELVLKKFSNLCVALLVFGNFMFHRTIDYEYIF